MKVRRSSYVKFTLLCVCYSDTDTFLIFIAKSKDLESGGGSADKVKAGTAFFLIELERKRAIKAGDYYLS